MARRKHPPYLPPAELPGHNLGRLQSPSGPWLIYRIHRPNSLYPTHMAPKGALNGYRFDDTRRLYRVLYAADTIDTCVLETIIRNQVALAPDGEIVIERSQVEQRLVSVLELDASTLFVPMSGDFLTRYSIPNICTCDSYHVPQHWSRALYDHPGQYHGLSFRSRYFNDTHSHAIFDRSYLGAGFPSVIKHLDTQSLLTSPLFHEMLDRRKIIMV